MIPKSGVRFSDQDHAPRKRDAERRKAHCPTMSAPTDKSAKLICARRAHCFFQRAHLSALTLAALATGYYPDGSAPEPGFPRRPLTGVSPVSPTERKNMPRLSTLRADRSLCRSTGDLKPPGNGVDETLRAGTASRSSSIRRHRLTSLNNERGGGVYCHCGGKVKAVGIFADESKHFAARVFVRVCGTPMILSITSPRRAGRGRIAKAIRVRGRRRESEPSRWAPSSRPSPRTRGEGEAFVAARSERDEAI